ncbi:MAG: hypothetical protein ACOX50_03275 [Patescibacteria group bacterium]|jgi:hypothetical protein
MAILGLLIISLAWFYQLFFPKKQIQPIFVGVYSLGVVFLIIDGFLSGAMTIAIFNILTLAPAVLLFLKLRAK